MSDIGSWRAPLAVAVLIATVLGAVSCEFYTMEYENPLDPRVSVDLEEIEFADRDFALMVYNQAEGQRSNDVEYIDGDAQGVSSLEGIQYLSNLRELRFWSESSVSSLVPVGQLRQLEVLQLNDANVTDLSPLSRVASLRGLFIKNNNIASLEPLSGLPNFRRLAVSGSNAWSGKYYQGGIEGVAALTGLEEVELHGFDLETAEDLAPILGIPNLDGLWIFDSSLSVFPTTGAIKQLGQLAISWNPITTLPESQVSFPNLRYLGIQGLQLVGDGNYSRLSNISAPVLEQLRIGSNYVDDGTGNNADPTTRIPNLSQYPELRRLSVRDSDVTDISGLSSLSNLEELDLDNQQTGINDFSPLQGLSRLRWVSLGRSGFSDSDVQYLSGKSDLYGVGVGENEGLVTLAGFAALDIDHLDINGLPNVTSLNLSNIDHIRWVTARSHEDRGPLESVSGGSGAGIEELDLSNQSISDVTALGNLTTLNRLQLAGNPVTSGVRSLARLTSLRYLDLTGTNVSEEDIVYLSEQLPNTGISW